VCQKNSLKNLGTKEWLITRRRKESGWPARQRATGQEREGRASEDNVEQDKWEGKRKGRIGSEEGWTFVGLRFPNVFSKDCECRQRESEGVARAIIEIQHERRKGK